MKEFLSPDEAAAELGMTGFALRRRLRSGIAKGTKVGHSWIITREEVERLKGVETDGRRKESVKIRESK